MGMYRHVKETFQQEYKERSDLYRARLAKWNKEPSTLRLERPTNLVRARTLGYKAKKGFAVVRVKVGRGSRKRPHPWGGRKPGKNYAYVSPAKSLQHIAQERVARKFSNMEVLNSYWVGENSTTKFFEVILVDMQIQPMQLQRGRAFRGLTHAARKHRNI
ncbi:50S ribosomal protein L15e [Candidatus Micrarchaeota archaeon]|nr:50S ribosomal protein L15e [Candidatus Micrarchaeota archaeon]